MFRSIFGSASRTARLQVPLSARSASSTAAESTPAPTHFLITLLRSPIGLPPASRQTLTALGLNKLHTSVIHPFSETCAGQILRIKELVEVKNVTADQGREIMRMLRTRGEGKGWEVAQEHEVSSRRR